MANPHERIVYDIRGNPSIASIYRVELKRPSFIQFLFKGTRDIERPIITIEEEGRTFDLRRLRAGNINEEDKLGQCQVYISDANPRNGIYGYYIYPKDHSKGSIAEDYGMNGIKIIGDLFDHPQSHPIITIGNTFSFQIHNRSNNLNTEQLLPQAYFEPEEITIGKVQAIELIPLLEDSRILTR